MKAGNYCLKIFFIFLILSISSCNGGNHRNFIKLSQYMVQGMFHYREHCANCHQVDGTGLAKLIPPLAASDYLMKLDNASLACQVRYGLRDSIIVNDTFYHQEMPGLPRLTPLEIAEIVTYVNNTWGAETGLYGVKQTEKDLANCNAQD